jgi:hypothetical protein
LASITTYEKVEVSKIANVIVCAYWKYVSIGGGGLDNKLKTFDSFSRRGFDHRKKNG